VNCVEIFTHWNGKLAPFVFSAIFDGGGDDMFPLAHRAEIEAVFEIWLTDHSALLNDRK
jgi:hypothetical protein